MATRVEASMKVICRRSVIKGLVGLQSRPWSFGDAIQDRLDALGETPSPLDARQFVFERDAHRAGFRLLLIDANFSASRSIRSSLICNIGPAPYASAFNPFARTRLSSFSEGPSGRFSPRSHLLTIPFDTLR